ncbi:MAG: hypothetical protein IJX37_01795 [Oscillospiraceae bacterium]|nr:hypothetical protein [Oscillospiraceae bacterium]
MTIQEIVELFEQLELHLINSLKRNLMRHRRQEQDEGGKDGVPENWEAWQSAKLRDVRRFRRENEKILGEYMPTIEEETEKLLREQYAEGGADSFFGSSNPKLESLIHEMQNNEVRVKQGCLRYMSDVYRKTILRTATAMNAGGMSMHKAVDEATADFLAQGINCIRYSNGRLVNIASYAEMALRTCNTRAMLMGEAKQRERLGIDTVLVSQYGACSDTCLPWQGRVYIDDVFQTYNGPRTGSFGISRNGRQYMLLSVAIKAGLFHPNCRHTITTWIEGVSTMPKPMDIKEIERVNKLEKTQRALERNVRKAKRQAECLTDPEAQKAAKAKVREAQAELREFVKKNGDVLRRDPWRERNDLAKSAKPVQEDTVPAEKPNVEADTTTRLDVPTSATNSPNEKVSTEKVEVISNTPQKPDSLSRGCDDVTKEWLDNATPNSHEVSEVTEFKQDGTVYRVDGVNVQLSYDDHEKEIAELLKQRLGGDIRLMPTVKGKFKNIKTPDYLFRGERYDLKTMSKSASSRAVYNRIKESLDQADNFVLDITNNPLGTQEILRQIEEEIFTNYSTRSVKVIIVVENGEIIKILKRK